MGDGRVDDRPLEGLEGEEEEEVFACGDEELTEFDKAVGVLEEVVMCESFREGQEGFFRKYRGEFTEGEENKLCYTTIHTEFVGLMEEAISGQMQEAGVDMASFLTDLSSRNREELEGDLWDMMFSLTDFCEFKSMMLAYPEDPGAQQHQLSIG